MLIIVYLASSLTVCGFFAYVLVQFHREDRRLNAHKKRLQEHLYEMEPETPSAPPKKIARIEDSRNAFMKPGMRRDYERPRFYPTVTTVPESNVEALARRETLIGLILGVGGLAALFAGIQLLNFLVTRLHWY
jgi:hypothetical protein